MNDRQKTKEQLFEELAELRGQVASLEMRCRWAESLIEAAPLGIHACDTEGRIIFVNAAQEAVTGYAAEELLGTRVWERTVPGPERDSVPPYMRQLATEQPTPTPYSTKNVRKNGEVFDIRVDWNYLRDPQGELVGFVSFVSDITEQNRVEDALRAERNRAQQYLDVAAVIMVVLDAAGNIGLMNRKGHELLGYPEGTLVGRNWFQTCVPERVRTEVLASFRQLMAGELEPAEYYENPVVARGGEERTIAWHNALLKDAGGQVIGTLSSGIDITACKRAEEAIQASEAKYRRLHQSMRDAFVSVTMDGCIREYNEAYRQMLGYEDHELAALRYTDVTPEKWHAFEAEIVEKQVLARGYSDTYEKEYCHKDGTIFPVELRTILITDDGGRPAFMWAVVRDISARKRILAELQQAHDELEQRVEERTAELSREIDHRTQAQAALQATEERYRSVVEDQTEFICRFRADGTFVFVNDVYCRFFGKASEELLGHQWQPVAWAEDLPAVESQLRALSPANPVVTIENRVRSGRGEVRWMQFVNRGFFDRAGRLTEVQAVGRDITDRVAATEALAESEAKYRHLVEATDTGYLILDAEGRVVDANAEYVRLTGRRNLDDIRGCTVLEWTAPHDRERNAREVAKCQQTGFVRQLEVDYVGPDGRIVPVEVNASVVDTKRGRRILSLCNDITDRKRAERELQQSRDELQAIYDGMVDGLLIADCATGQLLRTNPAMCGMLGYPPERLLSMSVRDIHPPEVVPEVLQKFRTQPEGLRLLTTDRPVLRADGSVFNADISNTRINYHGRPCIIGLFRDITQRQRAEEAVRRSEERYRGVVEACPDAVVMSDLQGTVLFASRQTWRLLRLPDDLELAGRSVFDYVVEADRASLAANMAHLVRVGVRRNTEYTALCLDGATVPVEASSVVIRDAAGRPQAVMAVIRDITDRRRAQLALERERRTLELMLRASDHERQTIAYDIHDGLAQQLAGAIMQFQIYEHAKDANPEQAAKAHRGGVSLLQQGHAETRRIISGVRPPILDESGVVAAIAHLVHDPSVADGPQIEFFSKAQFQRLPSIVENAIYRIVQEGLSNARKHSGSPTVRIRLVQQGDRVRIEIRDWGVGFNPKKVAKNRFGLPGMRERARLLGGKCRIRSAAGAGTVVSVVLPLPPNREDE